MNLAVMIGIAGALGGTILAAFALGMSRSPAWPDLRLFALVAATAAGYCGFDLALVMDIPAAVAEPMVQVSLGFGGLHGAAWIRYLAAADRRPLRTSERWLIRFGVVLALCALVPGVLIGHQIILVHNAQLGITYRIPQPTTFGIAAIVYFGLALFAVAAGSLRRWREGWHARFPVMGVAILGLLAVNDSLASARMIGTPLLLDGGAVLVVIVTGLLQQRRFAADARRLEQEVADRSRDLVEAQAALARSERMAGLGRLAAGVAHEINNPAAVIQHNLELLKRARTGSDDSASTGLKYIESALAATHRIGRIVRQLLDAGRATSLEPGRFEPFAIEPVVRGAIAMAERATSGCEIRVHVEEGLSARGDAGLLEQAVMNLITNAAHALAERGANGRIEIEAVRHDDRVRIAVRDNGPGIPETVRERLFEPFVTTKPVGKGTGLGLAVSHGLMRSQQGELVMVHSSDTGTEMALDLAWAPSESIAATAPAEAVPPSNGRAIRLLIVDDDPDLLDVISEVAREHFEVDAASSIDEAIDRVKHAPAIDVVMCDLMMPDGGAETWLARCGDVAPALTGRTIFITGGPTNPAATALVEAHRDRVLFKPFDLNDLRRLVERVAPSAAVA